MAGDHDMDDAEDNNNSIVIELEDEDHTLGNLLSNVMWTHPHITVAQYFQEDHNSEKNQILLHCQTENQVSAEQGVVEALHITKAMFSAISDEMDVALKKFTSKKK